MNVFDPAEMEKYPSFCRFFEQVEIISPFLPSLKSNTELIILIICTTLYSIRRQTDFNDLGVPRFFEMGSQFQMGYFEEMKELI